MNSNSLSIQYSWKNNRHKKAKKFKYYLQGEVINLNYLINHILYQTFKIILGIYSKNTKH